MTFLEDYLDRPLRDVLPRIQLMIMRHSKYFGVPTLKSPFDWWIYMEILYDVQPDFVIDLGTHRGGSALALAHVLDGIGSGQVISVGLGQAQVPPIVRKHPRITLLQGGVNPLFEKVKAHIPEGSKVLVVEDSDHSKNHTLEVLRNYSKLISVGSYLIIEDGIAGHGLDERRGPYEVVEEFLKENDRFIADRDRERFVVTWNPKGYLKRVK